MKALKLPFTKTQKAEFKNDALALNNNVFVDSAIKELLGTKAKSSIVIELKAVSICH